MKKLALLFMATALSFTTLVKAEETSIDLMDFDIAYEFDIDVDMSMDFSEFDTSDWNELIQDNSERIGLTAAQAHEVAEEISHEFYSGDLPIGGTISARDMVNISLNDMNNVGTADFNGTQVTATYVESGLSIVSEGEELYEHTLRQIGINTSTPIFQDEETTVTFIAGVNRLSYEGSGIEEGVAWSAKEGANLVTLGFGVSEKLSEDTTISGSLITRRYDGKNYGVLGVSITHYEDIGDLRIGASVGVNADLENGGLLAGVGMISIEEKGETGFFVSPTSVGLIAHDDKGQRYELTLNPIGVVMNLAAGNATVFDFVGEDERDWAINK